VLAHQRIEVRGSRAGGSPNVPR